MSLATLPAPLETTVESVAAGYLLPWQVDELIPPPVRRRRSLASTLGPGILLAGSGIGAGEWLFGPAVTAQYGGTLLWLATISIVLQVFYNLEVMRYTLYCGEPIFSGFFRTWPGPRLWTLCYMTLFIAHIWPFMASNAAVPLAAAVFGHLPGEQSVSLLGAAVSESMIVKLLGFAIFFAAFVPLVFGGKVYTMLERIMTLKLVVVLGFLVVVSVMFVSARNAREILLGFVRFGSFAVRAPTVIAGRHFTLSQRQGDALFTIQGTVDRNAPLATAFLVTRDGSERRFDDGHRLPADLGAVRAALLNRVTDLARPGKFYVEDWNEHGAITIRGDIDANQVWRPATIASSSGGRTQTFNSLDDLPAPLRERVESLVANQGLSRDTLWNYWRRNQKLPDLDWAMLAAFVAIAGAGGLSNSLLSNYARDKGWGMGYQTGAIPSAIGGRAISLSHVGKVFRLTPASLARWRGWMRYIIRDQVGIWMVCCFIGLALPCMLSLQFIRNAPVSGNRVAAMTAEGIANQFPAYGQFWWSITLLVSFLALAPNAVMSGDLIARLWTDILWVGSRRAQRMEEHQVKYIYYSILLVYAVWGSLALALLNPLQIAKLGAVLGNVALAFSSFHTLYVNRTLLPPQLRPNWFMQAGLVLVGVFFLLITFIAATNL